jgi:hypothetical protein
VNSIVTLAYVLDPVERATRIPSAEEMVAIARYIDRITHAVGQPPICDHTVPGVGEVLFSRDPSTPIPLSE